MGFLLLYNNLIYKESLSMQKIYFEIEYTLKKKWLLYLEDKEIGSFSNHEELIERILYIRDLCSRESDYIEIYNRNNRSIYKVDQHRLGDLIVRLGGLFTDGGDMTDTEYLVKHTLKIHKQPIKTHRAIKPIDTKVTRPILREDKTW